MVQTKEEKNKVARQNRFSRDHSRYQGWFHRIIEFWLKAKREKMSHEAMLAYRSEWIIGTDAYKALKQYHRERLDAVWETMQALAYKHDLVFCYPHPETGVIAPSGVICDAGLARELSETGNDKKGAYYWKNDDGTFTHAWS